ncbi:MAG: serine/threonine-protein kinase [Myxococcota bacterium]
MDPLDSVFETTRTARACPEGRTDGAVLRIRPGETVGRFLVLRCIGSGGMGQVYAAYDPRLDRRVALKVLHEGQNPGYDPRLIREAQALARLSHPNVVAVFDVGVHDGRLFVAMEFVEGQTLRDWLRQHPLGRPGRLEVVHDLLLQAGEGLAAAHRAGLVHRDFKPSNVLIGDDGRVRVADFGLVRVQGREEPKSDAETMAGVVPFAAFEQGTLTRPGSVVGTPAYMAPEQFSSAQINPACDQFGFCVTAWEALFGMRPFGGDTAPEMLDAMRRGRVEWPEGVAPGLGWVVALRKGLAFDPSKRFHGMEALLETLRSSRADGAHEVRGRQRWIWLSVLLAAGLAIGAASFTLMIV